MLNFNITSNALMSHIIYAFIFIPIVASCQITAGDSASPNIFYKRINAFVPPAAWNTNTLSLDIDGDNINDFMFSDYYSSSPSHTQDWYSCQPLNGFEIVSINDSTVIDTIPAGQLINSSLNWKHPSVLYSYTYLVMSGLTIKGLFSGKPHYAGFRKKTPNDTIYGWLFISKGSGISIISYAFERDCSKQSLTVNSTSGFICPSETVTLSANGANSYTWSTGGTGSSIIISPTITTSYTVTGSNLQCPLASVFTQSVDNSSSINVTGNSTLICIGETSTLSANGVNTYTWSTGSNAANIIVTPSVTTNYTVTGTNALGCISTAIITLSVNACIGIEELEALQHIVISPNPAGNKLYLQPTAGIEIKKLGLLTIEGKEIPLPEKEKNEIAVSALPEGIYFLRVETDRGILTKKVVIQR